MSPLAQLCLVLSQGSLSAWLVTPQGKTRSVKIHGEEQKAVNATNLAAAVRDVLDRLKGESTRYEVLHWLLDEQGWPLWAEAWPAVRCQIPDALPVQVFAWAWLQHRLGLPATTETDRHTLTQTLFPWLVSTTEAAERAQMQEALAREHEEISARLAAERQRLLQENERLRAENAALQQIDCEKLLTYLPALYTRVFTVLGGQDLALLCGRVEPFTLPNPYPEPSEETLRVLQRDFRALPQALQRQIVGFVARLPQRQKLNPRPEMRERIAELEDR